MTILSIRKKQIATIFLIDIFLPHDPMVKAASGNPTAPCRVCGGNL